MVDADATIDPISQTITRLLAGPARPGQAFTMPDCNFDGLYRMARRLKVCFKDFSDEDASICLFTEDRAVMAAALLAALDGGPQILLPYALSKAALQDLHRLTVFSAVIGRVDGNPPDGVHIINPETLSDEVESLAPEKEPNPDRPWVRLFTGGSTGSPQLWTKTPRNLLGEVNYLLDRFKIGSGDRILATVPAFHIYGMLYSLLAPLLASARVSAVSPSFPEEIKQKMAEMSPTIFVSVPIHYRALRDNPPDKGALRLAFSSAGPLPEADGRAFFEAAGVDLVEIYGSTETGGIATRCRRQGQTGFTPYDCIGWRVAGEELDIQSAFLSAELPVRDSGWFTMADRVKTENGGFVVVGRADNVVKVGGNRVDLEKVRQAIAAVEGIKEAIVLSNPADTGRSEEIVALAVGRRTAAEIQVQLKSKLLPHERPRRIQIVEKIPMAATGKPDRQAIGEMVTVPMIRFEPSGRQVLLDTDRTLQELAADHAIDIRSDCGGKGICGKCRVLVDPKKNLSSPTDAELDLLTPEQVTTGYRLACQARATAGTTVTVPDTLAEVSATSGKTGIDRSYPVDSPIHRLTVAGRSPGLKTDNRPESLMDWLATQVGRPSLARADMASLRQLSRYRDSLKDFTLVVHEDTGIQRILDGPQPASLGFAVDLGTTSIAGYLCNLQTGTLLAAEASVNPQRRFGEDVISRISHLNEKTDRLGPMQQLAVEGINLLLTRCLEEVGCDAAAIDEVAVCGNTTMQQIFAGLHPYNLGISPYFPLTLTPPTASAGDLGLAVDPAVPVFLMPVVSGFVGGDTMAAIMADRTHEREETTLIVDIGTNGEVVLGNREGLWVTSCATGPALEGARISCGMRAVSGAIHRAWPDSAQNGLGYAVMGNEKKRPMGICGSGIIDIVASLRKTGVILPNGRFDENNPAVLCDEKGVGRSYTIADGERTATGSAISLTLDDIRQVQLAKGALCTGIEFLMERAGIATIHRAILTGAFGARFNWKNALAIGMLPPAVAQAEVLPEDNLAGVGVVMALLDKKIRSEARELCRRIRYLELASDPDFAEAFAKATTFPNAAD
ncbi:hypothetical protein DSCW_27980 [Desulfosarcina widdelii]|uniref:2Fe-2S ferredoxin-type domain-containing protein n=1 Tax=Desulfosarcina widdelii TaxID=947919 RepID=A0A5K7Z6R6_9BACT|nr:ASKHA domain-containing protein [Desulfosarcina widdelii]BBO75381.1 hypothetical protein DSCW_27980 [Desulfosarcina widdelii]